jgi:hypothetical protein
MCKYLLYFFVEVYCRLSRLDDEEDQEYCQIDLEGIDLENEVELDQSHRWDRPAPRQIDTQTESLGEFVFLLVAPHVFSPPVVRY